MSTTTTIGRVNLDVDLLRRQRDWLLEGVERDQREQPEAEGLINLLDRLLDIAEGYA